METKYVVEITKVTNEEKCEYLVGNFKNLDELVGNINKFVERMRPIGWKSKSNEICFSKDSRYKEIKELKEKLIKKLADHVGDLELFKNEVELLENILEYEKD